VLTSEDGNPTPISLSPDMTRRRHGSKMSHLVATELRRQIVRGQVAPGDTLPNEAHLMQILDVSRDTLREALRMLESESLIYIRRGRNGGAVVRRPDLRSIARYVALLLQTLRVTSQDIHEARVILEAPTVALLSHYVSPELSQRLVSLQQAQQLADRSDPLTMATSLIRFDQAVIDTAGNGMLSLLSGIFRDSYAGEIYLSLRQRHSRSSRLLDAVLAKQAAIVDAVQLGSHDKLSDLWLEYLDDTRRLINGPRPRPGPINVTALWRTEVATERAHTRTEKIATTIAVEIRSRLAEGQLNSGDKLPALPELAATFGVSRPTLREALRVLERESLLDLRTGTRGGAHLQGPSTRTAAQLAAIVIESQQTTIGDLWEARAITEPKLLGLVAQRITPAALHQLQTITATLATTVNDTPKFTTLWGQAEKIMLGQTGNPAITVAMELTSWIRTSCRNELTADAINFPWVERSNRRATHRLNDVLTAATKSDPNAVFEAWTDYITYTTPFFQNLGDRLLLDMLD
jgi:DNA-binding FadR family transcriptional regulator